MVKIVIQNLGGKEVEVLTDDRSILEAVQRSGTDWMHACGAKGRCTTCRFEVIEGEAGLLPLTPAEENYRRRGALRTGERLACQARAQDTVVIRVPADCQLPHLHYDF